MATALRITTIFATAILLPLASAFDSRNVSATEWQCTGSLAVSFAAAPGLSVSCGTEVLQNVTTGPGIAPTFTLADAKPFALYTVLVVDRDAPNAGEPSRSPLRHMAAGDVAGSALVAGWSGGASSSLWLNYTGPQPPNGTACHRYYAIVYEQAAGVRPSLSPAAAAYRFNWDFPGWAANATNGPLVKVAVNVWRTQNLAARTGGCDAPAPPSTGMSQAFSDGVLAAILGTGGALALLIGAAALRTATSGRGVPQRRPTTIDLVPFLASDRAQ